MSGNANAASEAVPQGVRHARAGDSGLQARKKPAQHMSGTAKVTPEKRPKTMLPMTEPKRPTLAMKPYAVDRQSVGKSLPDNKR